MKAPRWVVHDALGVASECWGPGPVHSDVCDRATAAIKARDAEWRDPDLSGPMTPAELWRDYQVVLGDFCTRFNVPGSPSLRSAVEYAMRGRQATKAAVMGAVSRGYEETIKAHIGPERQIAAGRMLEAVTSAVEKVFAAAPAVTPVPEGAPTERSGIYIASRVKHARRWQAARSRGVPIISSWIDEAGDGDTADLGELWSRIQREVSGSERVVFYVEADDFPFKGALVEIGMALSLGVPVFLVLDPDVVLEERSLRPLGSWAKHPGVRWSSTLADAFAAPATPPTPSAPPAPREDWPPMAVKLDAGQPSPSPEARLIRATPVATSAPPAPEQCEGHCEVGPGGDGSCTEPCIKAKHDDDDPDDFCICAKCDREHSAPVPSAPPREGMGPGKDGG